MKKEELFTSEEKEKIISIISNAELKTSGEIKVHVENHCKEMPLDRAAHIFSILKLHKTKDRNGVLFYLAVKDHKFAILGDAGINQVVPENFWDEIKKIMESKFKESKFVEGLCEGIEMAGDQLKKHFPYNTDDKNELSNDISFGKN